MNNFINCYLWLALVLSIVGQNVVAQEYQPQTNLARTWLQLGAQKIVVQTATTYEQQKLGLMHLSKLDDNDGMLFVYPKPLATVCFWMKNTLIPLSVAFIDEHRKITLLKDMQPLDETNHCAFENTKYVLEMNQGWFSKNNIKTGDTVLFLDD